jgi:hypothetical protein
MTDDGTPTNSANGARPPTATTELVATATASNGTVADDGTAQVITDIIVQQLTGLVRFQGRFLRLHATAAPGTIDLTVTRVNFEGDDRAVRLGLYPSAPVPFVPAAVTDIGAGPGDAA